MQKREGAIPREQWIAGSDGLPKLLLGASDGASAEIYAHGAQVCSWRTPEGRERLFLSSRAQFAAGAAIRGGVPLIFPQFSNFGPLLKHGFARLVEWQCVAIEHGARSCATFSLGDDESTRRIWPHGFAVELRVGIGGDKLELALKIANTGDAPFNFTAALHGYFRISDIERVSIAGLHGLSYLDNTKGETPSSHPSHRESSDELRVTAELDRIYSSASRPIVVEDSTQRITSTMSGFEDIVLWNPGAKLAASLKDLEREEYRSMLCIEAAKIIEPVTLRPGDVWSGAQELSVRDTAGSSEP